MKRYWYLRPHRLLEKDELDGQIHKVTYTHAEAVMTPMSIQPKLRYDQRPERRREG